MSPGELTAPDDLADDPVERVLRAGEVEIEGRMPWSSNGTFLVTVTDGDVWTRAIYKPRRGERPLWDFPAGLDRREVATYELARQLGWSVVPQTVLRDGPLGQGSVQRFVDADFEEHYFTLHEAGRNHRELQALCLLDLLANNADRKSGHCLVSVGGEVFGIDHGLCFHPEPKLRTVLWDFAGDPIPDDLAEDVARFADQGPGPRLVELLTAEELDALCTRARSARHLEAFPGDPTGQRYPWPLV